MRLNNPGPLQPDAANKIYLGGTAIQLPLSPHNIWSGYYMDGGTIAVEFADATGARFNLCLDGRMSSEGAGRDFYVGARHPRKSGAINIGPSDEAMRVLFAALNLDETRDGNGYRTIDHRFPRVIDALKRSLR
jgi:hypothetical protein